jgi:hypothetical protein
VADRWEADRAAMLTIPPVGPPDWWPLRTRLGRDHYIRLDTNGYSVRPRAIGHIVTVRSDTEEITVTCGRPGGSPCALLGQTPVDRRPGAHSRGPSAARGGLAAAGRPHAAQTALLAADSLGIKVEQRELGTYDRMFTLIEGGDGKEET